MRAEVVKKTLTFLFFLLAVGFSRDDERSPSTCRRPDTKGGVTVNNCTANQSAVSRLETIHVLQYLLQYGLVSYSMEHT